jgi:hypothetical protein
MNRFYAYLRVKMSVKDSIKKVNVRSLNESLKHFNETKQLHCKCVLVCTHARVCMDWYRPL